MGISIACDVLILFYKCSEHYKDISLEGDIYNIREGNGTPLQDSCLENPMDGGAW